MQAFVKEVAPIGAKYSTKPDLDVSSIDIYVSPSHYFHASFPNLVEKYVLPEVSKDEIVSRWTTYPMKFWQNQLNFAIWCATSGCGVSVENTKARDELSQSLFKFHIYYQTRRILKEMSCPLPTNSDWNAYDNNVDMAAYERICTEFKVPPTSDWHVKGPNHGLGNVLVWYYGSQGAPGRFIKLDTPYDKDKDVFMPMKQKLNMLVQHKLHIYSKKFINYIKQQQDGIKHAWTTFILEKVLDFYTLPGAVRIDESIRNYCWSILGAQGQTRSSIVSTQATSLDAQKQFLANVEDAINRPVDLPSDIARYEDTLRYAKSKVDFVFYPGLYMAPSDMELNVGVRTNYNNEIVVAPNSSTPGHDIHLNAPRTPEKVVPHSVPSVPQREKQPSSHDASYARVRDEHEDQKTAIVALFTLAFIIFVEFW